MAHLRHIGSSILIGVSFLCWATILAAISFVSWWAAVGFLVAAILAIPASTKSVSGQVLWSGGVFAFLMVVILVASCGRVGGGMTLGFQLPLIVFLRPPAPQPLGMVHEYQATFTPSETNSDAFHFIERAKVSLANVTPSLPFSVELSGDAVSKGVGWGVREIVFKPIATIHEHYAQLPPPDRLTLESKDCAVFVKSLSPGSFRQARWANAFVQIYKNKEEANWTPAQLDPETGFSFTFVAKPYLHFRYYWDSIVSLAAYAGPIAAILGLCFMFINRGPFRRLAIHFKRSEIKDSILNSWSELAERTTGFPSIVTLTAAPTPDGTSEVELKLLSERQPNGHAARKIVERDVVAAYRGIYLAGLQIERASATATLDMGLGPVVVLQSTIDKDMARKLDWKTASDAEILAGLKIIRCDEAVLGKSTPS